MFKLTFRFLAVCSCAVLCACSSNAPTRFYLLNSSPRPVTADSTPQVSQRQIGFWRVRIPEYLDRSGIVSRLDQDQLWIASNEKWAEPLQDNLTRVLSESFAAACSASTVVTLPQPLGEKVDFEVRPHFTHFERIEDRVVAELRVIAIADSTGKLSSTTLQVEEPCTGSDTADTVACMSRAVGQLSQQMNAALLESLPCAAS
ncbi:MAG: membrane integrity-associated transporter subunit PqiC [Deltaproteobacteria bacterium]|nr:membrane integrity-associated transporter subunit PqiC [Deltaproteobacteria bacterium]